MLDINSKTLVSRYNTPVAFIAKVGDNLLFRSTDGKLYEVDALGFQKGKKHPAVREAADKTASHGPKNTQQGQVMIHWAPTAKNLDVVLILSIEKGYAKVKSLSDGGIFNAPYFSLKTYDKAAGLIIHLNTQLNELKTYFLKGQSYTALPTRRVVTP